MRCVLTLAFCGAVCAPLAAQTVTQKPSAAVALPAPATPTPAIAATPAQKPPRRAEVNFSNGQLAVAADNASLNQILREIGRQTGIKITGGVAEERVFGKYGPSGAQEVLAELLDGTGSNMMLIAGEGGAAGQLILTPRHGGVTPPNPNAPGFDDEGADDDAGNRSRPRPAQGVSLYGESPSTQGGGPVNGVPATAAGAAGDPATSANPASQQTPNGIKTPQEIMQQLQQLRQQQQQQQTPPE
jgi:hypothetical protein